MKRVRLGVVVEGHGEVETIGILMRRIADEFYHGMVHFDVPRPVRRPRSKLVRRRNGAVFFDDKELFRAVELAAKNSSQKGAILLMVDADDDLPCAIAPELLRRMRSTHSHLQHSVVLPTIEFEAWYLAAAGSLAGVNGMPENVEEPFEPETIRAAKAWLAGRMQRPYSETIDQPKFASRFDLVRARRCSSFDKLCRDIDGIVQSTPCLSAS
jgi:hypothetical protein